MWLWLIIVAHLINAVAFLVDKILLAHAVRPPRAYAFFIGILSSVALFLIPFGVGGISIGGIVADLVVGAFFILALWAFFVALKFGEASRVVPFLGGTIPILTWVIEWIFGSTLLPMQGIAVLVLTLGTVLIAVEPRRFYHGSHTATPWRMAIIAAICFAFAAAAARILFLSQGFVPAFFWQRMGSVLAALAMLLPVSSRREIMGALAHLPLTSASAFLGNQLLGAIGFFILQYALTGTSATVVQSLQGVQYIFLLFFVIVFSLRYPRLLSEQITPATLILKLASTGLIVAGIAVLARAA